MQKPEERMSSVQEKKKRETKKENNATCVMKNKNFV